MKEASSEKKKKESKSSLNAQKITAWVKNIAAKVPQITKLEKKLGMLQGLDPVLEGIVSDLDRVTDYSAIIKLQKEAKSHKELPESDDAEVKEE